MAGIQHKRHPKVVIISSQNERQQQIQEAIENQFIKEASDPPFNLFKDYVSQTQKQISISKEQEQNESFRTIFDVNQVFVLLDRKFLIHLIHGNLNISEVDYLIFDEVHSTYPQSDYVDIMKKVIFNHNLMLSSPGQLKDNMRLPKFFAFFNLHTVIQAAQNDDSQIMKKFYFMANTFNASLLCLQKQDLGELEREIVREFSQRRVRNNQDISHLEHQVQNSLEFLQKARKYLSYRRDGKTRVTCFPEILTEKKQLQTYKYFEKKFAKITMDEVEFINQDLLAKFPESLKHQQIENQNNQYKPIIQTANLIFNKIMYFSSRIQFDEQLIQLLGRHNVKDFAIQIAIPSQNDESENQSLWLYSHRIYLNKTQSESQATLEMSKILHSKGYIDQNNTIKISIKEAPQSQSTYQCQATYPKQQDEEEKTSFRGNSYSTRFSKSLSPRTHYNPPLEYDNFSSKTKMHNIQDMLPRAYKVNPENTQVLEYLDNFLSREYNNNKKMLEIGLKYGKNHQRIMQFNTRQMKLFIQSILNPILTANNDYNGLCDTQPELDLFRFDNLNFNIISESSIKDILFYESFSNMQETAPSREANPTLIQFKKYRKRMFNIYNTQDDQRDAQEFLQLVQMIDQSLEKYTFPNFMTKHKPNYHRQERGKPSKSSPIDLEKFNRRKFLTMLMIALSDYEPSTMEFEKIKNEMGRLSIVGDSIINHCQVINMIFSGKKSFSDKDLHAMKNQTVKTEKLKKRAQTVGVDLLRIKTQWQQYTVQNISAYYEANPRDLGDVIKSLAGLFSIYLGFSASFLLLSDFGIVEPPTSDLMIKIGDISVAQKVEILKTISQNRRDLLDYKRDQKMNLFNIFCNQEYQALKKELLTGTEIVEVWKKLVKSRGLFMKHKLGKIFPEDLSQPKLSDFSISSSLKSNCSDDYEYVIEENSPLNLSSDNDLQLETVEYKAYNQFKYTNHHGQDEVLIKQRRQKQNDAISEDKNQQNVASSLRERCKNSKEHPIEGEAEEHKTGGQVINQDIICQSVKPNQTQVEVYERGYKELMQEGYEFKNLELLLQSIVQRSTTEKLWNPGTKFNYSSSIEKDIIMQYNLQILEYLGDSILNFTVSKLFYCETADNQMKWHGDFCVPSKLNQLKTWFSSKDWLSFALYENYYCTITEEIPRDVHFQKSQIWKMAQESINKLKNKNISEMDSIEFAPRIPLIYDQNDKFQEQINYFNGQCFRQCLAADKNDVAKILNYPREGIKVTCKSLSLKLFKDKDIQLQDDNQVDSSEIEEKFVYGSDEMKALIGAIYMDSGDFDKTQMILLKLINCPSVTSFPIVQHDSTAVFSLFNSKPCCKDLKLSHNVEEKDGNIFNIDYMTKHQSRRLQYSKERKKKFLLFYYEIRFYLEDAYKEFEIQFIDNRERDDEREPPNDELLEFNKVYRKTWKQTFQSADQKQYSAIKEASKESYKFVSSAEENFRTRENQNVPEMRDQIIQD